MTDDSISYNTSSIDSQASPLRSENFLKSLWRPRKGKETHPKTLKLQPEKKKRATAQKGWR